MRRFWMVPYRRLAAGIFLMLIAALVLPSAIFAQKKQKDPVLQAFLEEQFAVMNRKLDDLGEKVAVVQADIARLKQQQADMSSDLRTAQTTARNTDSSLTSFRLSNQQDIISLKTDVARIRQDLAGLMEGAKKAEAAAPPAPEAPKLEGYVTAVTEKDVTISLGSASGLKVGSRFGVYKATDPKSQVGLVEVIEVLDANNSRAKIVHSKVGVSFEFSDLVRPE